MSPFKRSTVKGGNSKGKSPWLMLMTSLLGQRGPDHRRECMTLTSSDPMLLFRLMRTTLKKPHYWLKGLLTSHLSWKPTSLNGLPPRIETSFSPNGNSISVSSLSSELRVLTIIMFHNLYPLSSTEYMNLKRALLLHDLITDEEIDICAHIFHILRKTAARTDSRNYIPFCWLISRILKLKEIHPSEDKSPYPKPSPINIRTLNDSIGHSQKGIKTKTPTSHSGSPSSSSSYDEKLDNIMASIHDISTKMSELAFLLHHHNIRCDTKFTSL